MEKTKTLLKMFIAVVILGVLYYLFISPILHKYVLEPTRDTIYIKEFNKDAIFVCQDKDLVIKQKGWEYDEKTTSFTNKKTNKSYNLNDCILAITKYNLMQQMKDK